MSTLVLKFLFLGAFLHHCIANVYECTNTQTEPWQFTDSKGNFSVVFNEVSQKLNGDPLIEPFSCYFRFSAPDPSHFIRFHLTFLDLNWCREHCAKNCSSVSFYSIFNNNASDRRLIHKPQCSSTAPDYAFTTETSQGLVQFTVHQFAANRKFVSDFFTYQKLRGGAARLAFTVSYEEVSGRENPADDVPCNETTIITGNISTRGTIQSYRTGQGLYRKNETCKWLIQSSDSHSIVRFTLRHLDVEDACGCNAANCILNCHSDHVTVWNGPVVVDFLNNKSSIAMRQCGVHFYQCIFATTVNEVLVVFQTNNRVEFSGFIMDYEIIHADHSPSADGMFDRFVGLIDMVAQPTGVISSYRRSDTGLYRPNERAVWTFHYSNNLFSYRFREFDLGPSCSSLKVEQCFAHPDIVYFENSNCFCGQSLPNRTFDMPPFKGGYVTLRFRTDGHREYRGFVMSYALIPFADVEHCSKTEYLNNQTSGTIQNYVRKSGTFRRREDCSWVITAEGGAAIRISISQLNIDPCPHNRSSCDCNYLAIFEGLDTDGVALTPILCGDRVPLNFSRFLIASSKAFIYFKTADFDPDYPDDPLGSGFTIEYEIISIGAKSFLTEIVIASVTAVVIAVVITIVTRVYYKRKSKAWKNSRKKVVTAILGDMYIVPVQHLQQLFREMGFTEYAELLEKLAIAPEEVQVEATSGAFLAEGAFGVVRRGLLRGSVPVALKALKTRGSCEQLMSFLREGLIMQMLEHENILKLLGIVMIGQDPNIVFPFMENGSLRDFLWGKEDQHIKQLLEFCRQICSGMAYLANRGCVHRDLACRNILVSEDLALKIADFGFARELSQLHNYYRLNETTNVPFRWYPPESLQEPFVFTTESDVWSFGVTCWEMFACSEKKEPYDGMDAVQVIRFVCSQSGNPGTPSLLCPKTFFKRVLLESWKFDPTKRPNFFKLLKIIQAESTELDG